MAEQFTEYHEIATLGDLESDNPVGVLFVFPHSSKVTTGSAAKYLNPDLSQTEISDSVNAEYDLGTDAVIAQMRQNAREIAAQLGCNFAIAEFTLARSVADANRVSPTGITPDKLYAGQTIVQNPEGSREEIAEEYVWPYQRAIVEFIKQNPNVAVVHVHSMDQFSGGNSSIGAAGQGERPLAEVMTGAWIDPKGYSHLVDTSDLNTEAFQIEQLPDELIQSVCQLLTNALITHSQGGRNETAVNDPYDFNRKDYPPTLVALVTYAQYLYNEKVAKFLSVEARKDTQQTEEGSKAYTDTLIRVAGVLLGKS